MNAFYRRAALVIALVAATLLAACSSAGPAATPTPTPKAVLATENAGRVTLTILYDNYVHDAPLESGWGFACLVESAGSTVLFDTGGVGQALLNNMAALGKDPLAVEAVVLSHIHTDHTGGLPALLATGVRPKVYLHAGFDTDIQEMARAHCEVVMADAPMEIAPGIYTTGQVSGSPPEQALMVRTNEGLTVVTGCAHPGVVRMVQQAMDATGEQVTLVLGGFHLSSASESRIKGIIEQLRGLGVKRVGPTHCSGDLARTLFEASFGDGYVAAGVGRVLVIGP